MFSEDTWGNWCSNQLKEQASKGDVRYGGRVIVRPGGLLGRDIDSDIGRASSVSARRQYVVMVGLFEQGGHFRRWKRKISLLH